MTIPLPNLDDRSYEELMVEAQNLIPTIYPEWTDFNPADPGITLVELLAWLAEMVLYQVNDIPDSNVKSYLKLLNGADWSLANTDLKTAVRQSLSDLDSLYRAVTTTDYEFLALTTWPQQIQRAFCLANRNLCSANPVQQAPGHISLIIIPPASNEADHTPLPSDNLREEVWNFLKDRRLLAVRHHVVNPVYIQVNIGADLYLHRDAQPAEALLEAKRTLESFFDPLQGGVSGDGWPFGRHVFISDIYARLNQLSFIKYIDNVRFSGQNNSPATTAQTVAEMYQFNIEDYQLVLLNASSLRAITEDGRKYCFQNGIVTLCPTEKPAVRVVRELR